MYHDVRAHHYLHKSNQNQNPQSSKEPTNKTRTHCKGTFQKSCNPIQGFTMPGKHSTTTSVAWA